jgi:hypothetical protein
VNKLFPEKPHGSVMVSIALVFLEVMSSNSGFLAVSYSLQAKYSDKTSPIPSNLLHSLLSTIM